MQTFTAIADPSVTAIPIIDNQEPLVDLRTSQAIAIGPSPEIPNNQDYTKVRQSVYKRLLTAQTMLPPGLHLCLYEGYRSLALQEKLFNDRYQKLKRQHPNWSDERLYHETTVLVSPVTLLDNTPNVPPHSTGGAVDVYLLDDQGQAVDMGIHPKDWMQDTDGSLSATDSHAISQAARKNRSIMSRALKAAGFVNYGGEYWHWSYGDRYWAYHIGADRALFNSIH